MEKEECHEEDVLKNETINAELDGNCENKHKDGLVKDKHPVKPKVPEARLRSDGNREKARLWRKKRMLNGSKLSGGKEKAKLQKDAFHPRNVPKVRKGALYYTTLLTVTP